MLITIYIKLTANYVIETSPNSSYDCFGSERKKRNKERKKEIERKKKEREREEKRKKIKKERKEG